MELKEILEKRIKQKISSEKTNQIGNLSGSNALLFDDYNFEAESSDNCPRLALLRRAYNVQEEKSVKSFISNSHGRTFEDFLRSILSIEIENEKLEFVEEEQAEIKIEDDEGNILLTARPDKIIKYKDKIYPVEVKTIQSNTTAYSVFIKNKPKLGALIQLAIYMYGHKLNKGYLLYCASNWFSGFYGKTRWSVEPGFKIFDVELQDDGYIYYNGEKSIVTYEKIIKGSYEFLNYKNNKILPNRPNWLSSNGEGVSYTGCKYCFAVYACDYSDEQNNLNLEDFFNKQKELCNENVEE